MESIANAILFLWLILLFLAFVLALTWHKKQKLERDLRTKKAELESASQTEAELRRRYELRVNELDEAKKVIAQSDKSINDLKLDVVNVCEKLERTKSFAEIFIRQRFMLEILQDKAKELEALCREQIVVQQEEADDLERRAFLLSALAEKIRKEQKEFWEAVDLAAWKFGESWRKKSFRDYLPQLDDRQKAVYSA